MQEVVERELVDREVEEVLEVVKREPEVPEALRMSIP